MKILKNNLNRNKVFIINDFFKGDCMNNNTKLHQNFTYKKRGFLIFIVLLIVLNGCNRFEKDLLFQSVADFEIQFIETANNALKSNNIEPIMKYYHYTYNNYGNKYEDIVRLFTSETWTDSVLLTIERKNPDEYLLTLTDLLVRNEQTIEFYVEWEDQIERKSRNFAWVGYQPDIIENPQQLVIAQSLTYLTCTYCPKVKAELKKIEKAYPNHFLYLSYHSHFADPLSLYNLWSIEKRYWGDPLAPYVLLQGRFGYQGSSEITLYKPQVRNLIQETPDLWLFDLKTLPFEDNTLYGEVRINFSNLNTSDLYLFYVIYEKEKDNYYLYGNGAKASNVVRGRGYHNLENIVSDDFVNFSVTLEYITEFEYYLVVWVQKITDINRRQDGDKILHSLQMKVPSVIDVDL